MAMIKYPCTIYFSDKYNLAFVNSPKNACSTTTALLAELEYGKKVVEEENKYSMREIRNKVRRKKIRNEWFDDSNYTTFTVSRNPYSRIVSFYREKIIRDNHRKSYWKGLRRYGINPGETDMTFEEFVKYIYDLKPRNFETHLCTQWDNFRMSKCDEIIAFEDYDAEIRVKILFPLGLDPDPRNINSSGSYDYRDYYDDETKDLVYRMYKLDFDKLGYTF